MSDDLFWKDYIKFEAPCAVRVWGTGQPIKGRPVTDWGDEMDGDFEIIAVAKNFDHVLWHKVGDKTLRNATVIGKSGDVAFIEDWSD